ncbi:hypothetical protein CY34DRAFT_754092 [Suillus luteus UH-Slu-Lm8-n1]|uniref:Uncharacterized protein n=1 Tax=Suillus luteus UH-Slu-Lm8-n1 TaxID=930992 RepID=A0A0D0B8M1_9AGAM|nr:hypothetical protein CY34DRAFT_754092 [Suillus luteus UH-Slu-Lm8-n1]
MLKTPPGNWSFLNGCHATNPNLATNCKSFLAHFLNPGRQNCPFNSRRYTGIFSCSHNTHVTPFNVLACSDAMEINP